MKIQISYIKAEDQKAAAVVAAIRPILGGAKPKHSEKNENTPPRKYIYITIPEPKENP